MSGLLEAGNGSWSILSAYCVLFTLMYLVESRPRGRMTWWAWSQTIGVELAIVTAGICLAVVIARSPVWLWRFETGGDMAQLSRYLPMVGMGSLVGCVFFLWYLRIITRWVGLWPVVLALGSVLLYLATFIPRALG